jgi:glycine/D-amino acid oxidase-like deaminating enzyme
LSDVVPLPLDPATVSPDANAIERLQAICERLSPIFRVESIVARQACFRPVTQDGLPLIGWAPQTEGAAEGVSASIDLTLFDPIRLRSKPSG